MAKDLFRKKALQKLVSPEQLDQLMVITTPTGWVAILAAALITGVAVLWGIHGNVPTRVYGEGILMKSGGLHSIVTETSGRVIAIDIEPGKNIASGTIIAKIGHHDLVKKIQIGESELETLLKDNNMVSRIRAEKARLKHKEAEQEIQFNQTQIEKSGTILSHLRRGHTHLKELEQKGLINLQKIFASEKEIVQLEMDIRLCRDRIMVLEDEKIFINNSLVRETLFEKEKFEMIQDNIKILKDELETGSRVLSRHSGKITTVLVETGDVVNKGDTVAILEASGLPGKDLEALIFVPALKGKKIKKGMTAHISPSTVRQEEYGFIHGSVTGVSEFPISLEQMQHLIKNESLAKEFFKSGAPIQVNIDLETDINTPSGFSWSSIKGPPVHIISGTMCTSKITVKNQAPITLVIPMIKKTLLGSSIQ